MPTFVIDTDQITNIPGASAFTLTEAASIWIFQEGVEVAATNLAGGTGINGGFFDDSIVRIEGSVDATDFLLTNFGDNASVEVTATGRLGQTIAGILDLGIGVGNHLTNYGIIDASQVIMGPDGVVFNNSIINSNIFGPQDIANPQGAELLSNNDTIDGNVVDFRRVVNDGTITGLVSGARVDTTVINNGVIGGSVSFFGGNDTYDASGGGQSGRVTGNDGNDRLIGGPEGDWMDGEGDDDLLNGRGGDDSLQGSGGNDTLFGGIGNDLLRGQGGDNLLSGGEGDDRIIGGVDSDTANGNDGDDLIEGATGDDSLFGDAGSDTIAGGEGDDRINGGDGPDVLVGEAGDDNILGGNGNDTLRGGSGKDTLEGGAGDDIVRGGGGGDLFVFNVGSDIDVIEGFADDTDEISLVSFNFGSVNEALSFAQQVNDDVVFDFGGGDVLVVNDTTIAALQDDILI